MDFVLTLITPTGERPAAFALCQRMMARQTYQGPVHWIIVDDGRTRSPLAFDRPGWTLEVLRPKPYWQPGDNTQGRNLLAALDRVRPGALLTVIEDDDHYRPEWLQWIADNAAAAELIGEAEAIYYNVRTRTWRALRNDEHASLRCTAMRDGALNTFREAMATPYRYYDMRLWQRHEDRRVFPRRLTVGIKGMPGRPGIALGHDGKGNADEDCAKLRELIGRADADWYTTFFKESGMQKLFVIKPFRYNKRDWRVGDEFIPAKRIDGELHVHAKKVELREASAPPVSRPKPAPALKVESQTEKLKAATVERATPAPAPAAPESPAAIEEGKGSGAPVGVQTAAPSAASGPRRSPSPKIGD